jgi:hypothetical protein
VAQLAAVKTIEPEPFQVRERHHNEGHGRRLTAAFEALEAFPVLVESRNRVLRLFEAGDPSTAAVIAVGVTPAGAGATGAACPRVTAATGSRVRTDGEADLADRDA